MGFPWKKLAQVGITIVGAVVPGVSAIEEIAKGFPGMKGKDKQNAVVELVKAALLTIEGVKGSDLANDDDVIAATRAVIDTVVALQNLLARKALAGAGT